MKELADMNDRLEADLDRVNQKLSEEARHSSELLAKLESTQLQKDNLESQIIKERNEVLT